MSFRLKVGIGLIRVSNSRKITIFFLKAIIVFTLRNILYDPPGFVKVMRLVLVNCIQNRPICRPTENSQNLSAIYPEIGGGWKQNDGAA